MANKYHSNLIIDSPDIHPRLFNRLTHYIIPVASYVTGVTGTGTAGSGATVYALSSGTTANSTAYGRWNPAGDPVGAYGLNAAKTHLFKVGCFRVWSDAEFIGYIQFRYTSGVIGDLNENGFGFKLSNLTVEGESYGASGRASVALGTLTNNQMKYLWLKFTPGISIQFWFGTDPFLNPPTAIITDPLYIPTSALSIYTMTCKNGATGGIANQFLITPCYVWYFD